MSTWHDEWTMTAEERRRREREASKVERVIGLNDYYNDERRVLLSQKWIGTTGFQILIKRPKRLHMGERSTHKSPKRWPEEWPRLSETHKQEEITAWDDAEIRLQEAQRKGGIFDVSSEDTEHLQGDLRRSSKTRKVCSSFLMSCIPKDE